MNPEEVWVLFIISVTDGLQRNQVALYARDSDHACEQARAWIKEHQRELPSISVETYPGGYSFEQVFYPVVGVMKLPGSLAAHLAERVKRVNMRE